jgi:hypothetical protein
VLLKIASGSPVISSDVSVTVTDSDEGTTSNNVYEMVQQFSSGGLISLIYMPSYFFNFFFFIFLNLV